MRINNESSSYDSSHIPSNSEPTVQYDALDEKAHSISTNILQKGDSQGNVHSIKNSVSSFISGALKFIAGKVTDLVQKIIGSPPKQETTKQSKIDFQSFENKLIQAGGEEKSIDQFKKEITSAIGDYERRHPAIDSFNITTMTGPPVSYKKLKQAVLSNDIKLLRREVANHKDFLQKTSSGEILYDKLVKLGQELRVYTDYEPLNRQENVSQLKSKISSLCDEAISKAADKDTKQNLEALKEYADNVSDHSQTLKVLKIYASGNEELSSACQELLEETIVYEAKLSR